VSRYWATASTSNYLTHDPGSNAAKAFPYFYGGFGKFSDLSATRAIMSHSASGVTTRRGQIGARAVGDAFINELADVSQGTADTADGLVSTGVWVPIIGVVTTRTSRAVYLGSSSVSGTNTTDQGTGIQNRYTYIGLLGNNNAVFSNPMQGHVARCFRVEGSTPTNGEIDAFMTGTLAHSIWSCYGSWPLIGSDLNDYSGNGRTLTVVGTVPDDADEPFATFQPAWARGSNVMIPRHA
jgi:hypothetical protein